MVFIHRFTDDANVPCAVNSDTVTLLRSFLTASAMSFRLSVTKRSRFLSWWILLSRGLVFPVWKDFLARCTASCCRDILHRKLQHVSIILTKGYISPKISTEDNLIETVA